MTGPIVIVGSGEDEHVVAVRNHLESAGNAVAVVDSVAFPERASLALGIGCFDLTVAGARIGRPRSVYVRSTCPSPIAFGVDVEDEMHEDWRRTLTVFREKNGFLRGVLLRWEAAGVRMLNPPTASSRATKTFQLHRLHDAGLPVPKTLWTNSATELLEFTEGGPIAYKPVVGGARTQELLASDLDTERLRALVACPVTFQELLPGRDVRVFVIEGEIVASLEIETSEIDFRGAEERIKAIELSTEVRNQCLAAAALIGLRFTAIDLKEASDGTLKFLELNTSPMFLGFDQLGGTSVLTHLCEALAN